MYQRKGLLVFRLMTLIPPMSSQKFLFLILNYFFEIYYCVHDQKKPRNYELMNPDFMCFSYCFLDVELLIICNQNIQKIVIVIIYFS